MIVGRFRSPSALQAAICLVSGAIVTAADEAATVAAIDPFDIRFVGGSILVAVVLLVAFLLVEALMTPTEPGVPHAGRRRDERHAGRLANLAAAFRRAASAVADRYHALPPMGRLVVPALLMLLCWSPIIVMMYPGTIWYDTGDQIAQWYGIEAYGQPAGAISSHHPVLDTIVFGSLARLGDALAGDYQTGISAYILVQCVIMALELTGVCRYVVRVGRPGAGRGAGIALFAFFSLFPAFPIFMMSIVKDSLHLLAFVPWLVMVAETARTRLKALRSPRFATGLTILSVLAALTTMTGLYVTVLTLCCLPLTRVGLTARRHDGPTRADRLRAISCAAVTAIIAMIVFPAAVRGPLHVVPEDRNQLLVVPMQMTARYALDHPDDVTDAERAAIDRVNHVPFEDMAARYNPYLADPIIQYSLRDPAGVGDYLRAWASMGLRHPDSYIQAFAALESGWFALKRTPLNVTDRGIGLDELAQAAPRATANRIWFQIANAISPPFSRMPPYRSNPDGQASAYALWGFWQSTPVLDVLTLTALWTFVAPMFLLFRLARPRARTGSKAPGMRTALPAVYAAPLVWSLLSLLPNAISVPLKPTASRYMLWALVVIPFTLALCACAPNTSNASNPKQEKEGNAR
ncbi:hypothetical protein CPA40_09905 [Bifidobacterium callitrichos]|uniref:Beta-carotene 15,15'-monooxygenase n=1 Tax=Bifidobacterium callitrichos TaxID=762209 RepID=A0A2T3G831_9BIFI|nr:DUF6020 family protein [Bifidobacterium callitrichos]PST45644.1 hypothetical protein CPA40_09905 [Bifidobacterium callitrichos]